MNKYIAFLPIRGGSKGIIKKNIKYIAGKMLFQWVLDEAIQCDKIEKCIVSTDSDEIIEIVKKYYGNSNKVRVVKRSIEAASDTATTEEAMLEYAYNNEFQNIILIQATSPFTTKEDIFKAIDEFEKNNYDSLLTVAREKRFIWKNVRNKWVPMNYVPENRPRRQEFEGYYIENGALYITNRENLIKKKCRISGNIGIYEMNETSCLEIDEMPDWFLAEHLLRKKISQDLKNIKLFITDIDGVLTDGGMYISENDDEIKKFNTRDGKGIELLIENGIKVAFITSENRKLNIKRAKKLRVNYLYQGVDNKVDVIEKIKKQLKVKDDEIAYIGDDLNDLEVLKKVGFSACPSDANDKVKSIVKYVCKQKGGKGCVREVCDLIIEDKHAN
ncbi:MAG: HAD hydrolase family protein [Calditrichia bacterium]